MNSFLDENGFRRKLSLLANNQPKFVQDYVQALSPTKVHHLEDYNIYQQTKTRIFVIGIVQSGIGKNISKNIFIMNLNDPHDEGQLLPISYTLPPLCKGSDYPDCHYISFRHHIIVHKNMLLSIVGTSPRYAYASVVDSGILIHFAETNPPSAV